MTTTINTNVPSLNAQRQLSHTQNALRTSMTRLSSGLRVNSAKDDAAGLAIAERMSAQVRGMNVAVRNANDAISLAQTAEGALGQVGGALQRMRELAVQSRNATNSANDRDSLNKEFGELADEVARVIRGTSFNGLSLMGPAATTMSFQIGAGTGTHDGVSIAVTDLTAASAIREIIGGTAGTPAQANAAVRAAFSTLAGAGSHMEEHVLLNYADAASAAGAASALAEAFTHCGDALLFLNPTDVTSGMAGATSATQARTVFEANVTALGGVPPADVTRLGAMVEAAYAAYDGVVSPARASVGSAVGGAGLAQALRDLDTAIAFISDQRATFGAMQSRFESVIGNLQIGIENQSAARSRIMDADYASEAANLSRAQILQQAGTAMVAQANQAPQIVLQLLR